MVDRWSPLYTENFYAQTNAEVANLNTDKNQNTNKKTKTYDIDKIHAFIDNLKTDNYILSKNKENFLK